MRKRHWIAAAALLSLIFGACQSASAPEFSDVEPSGGQAEESPTTMVETEIQEPEVQTATQESEASAPDTEIQEEPAPVEVRQGLSATDPASVNLANGTPTFVEFFAFW